MWVESLTYCSQELFDASKVIGKKVRREDMVRNKVVIGKYVLSSADRSGIDVRNMGFSEVIRDIIKVNKMGGFNQSLAKENFKYKVSDGR